MNDFPIGEMTVAVEESSDVLTYKFTPRGSTARLGFPFALLLPLVVFPAGLLGLVFYASSRVENRPRWEEVLTGVFAAQMLVWLLVGMVESTVMLRWTVFRSHTTLLRFTATQVWHGGNRVCAPEQLRGLRLFVYPTLEKESNKLEACLSLVIGDAGDTHGLFGGLEQEQLRTLAEDIQRRLTTFRFNQGILAALEALSVVETTADKASELMHTRPPTGGFRLFATASLLLLQNRWVGSLWCIAMFAGLFATGHLILAAKLPKTFLFGHALVGFLHLAMLLGIWGQPNRSTTGENSEETP